MKPTAGRTGRGLVIGFSFKMYFGYQQTLDWCLRVREIAAASPAILDGSVRLFLMPSLPCLLPVIQMFRDTSIEVGAQNLYFEDRGPFTGEVSGQLLAEVGCRLVEVGHSERRRMFAESDEVVALKVAAALRNGLCPVICVGEEEPSDAADACRESTRQLESALGRIPRDPRIVPVIVAYEPLWAIGAEQPAPENHIAEVCRGLREFTTSVRPDTADRVIYGGSAGPGLLERLGEGVDGLFLGRHVHDPNAMQAVLDEAGQASRIAH